LKIIQKCYAEGVKPESSHFQKLLENQVQSEESDIEETNESESLNKDEIKEKTLEEERPSGESEKNKKNTKDDKERKNSKGSFSEEKNLKPIEEKDVEEKKLEDKMMKDKKVGKGVELPKRVVIITPPLYFDFDLRRKIVEGQAVKDLVTEWKEDLSTNDKISILLLNQFPIIKNSSVIQNNTIFIVAGFEQGNMKSTIRKLEDLASQKDRFKLSGAEFTYIHSKDKQRSVELLWDKYEKFKESIHQSLPNNYHIVHLPKPDKILSEIDMAFEKLRNFQANLNLEHFELETETSKEIKEEETKKKLKGKILVFIPIGIPGMGKTTFLSILKKLLEEKGCAITIISSDIIRKRHMDAVLKGEPSITEKKAFEKTAKPAKIEFFNEVENAISRTKALNQTHIIFLDKNHPPNIIQETIRFFEKPKYLNEYDIRTVILKPVCSRHFRTNSNVTYPFSLTFLLTCMKRAMARTNHETLQGDDLKVASVLIAFFNLYKNFTASEGYFKAEGAHFLMELPFTHEDVEIEKSIPQTLVLSFNNILQHLTNFEPDIEKVAIFLSEYSKLSIELKNPDPELLYQKSLENLNQCFQLFSK